MTVAITQSNYIPWKGYFHMIAKSDVFILYDTAQYTRRDWRNRNLIKTSNGLQWLTIPVKTKGNYYQPICETQISDMNWAEKHWETLRHNYAKAPFFKQFEPFFEELYLGCDTIYLSEINLRFLKGICALLGIQTEFKWSKDFDLTGDKTERLVNICKAAGATTYVTGPAAKAYMKDSFFVEADITLDWMNYHDYPEYNQAHGTFEHAVSVLDLIFNTGENARNYILKSFKSDSF